MKVESVVKLGKIYSIHKNRIIKKVGKLNIEKTREIIKILNSIIEVD